MAIPLRVFVSHSFAEEDADDIARILTFLRAPRFHLEVRTAQDPQARGINEKIEEFVDWADVTFGIFTKRFEDRATGTAIPPPYIISECSYAKARYALHEDKGVHGLVEEGIGHASLGIPSLTGEEFPVFRRLQFRTGGDLKALEHFIASLASRYGAGSQASPKRPYRQRELRKSVEILRNGTGIFKNTIELLVVKAQAATESPIEHTLWLPQHRELDLPPLPEMALAPLTDRATRPLFACACIGRGGRPCDYRSRVGRPKGIAF